MTKWGICATLAFLALTRPAAAQQKGQWDLDIKPVPGGIGVSYQFSDFFSVRPRFDGAGTGKLGNDFTIGTDFRYTFSPAKKTSPYLTASLRYQYSDWEEHVPHSGLFGAGIGLRYTLSKRWSIFGDTSFNHTTGYYAGQPRGSFKVGDGNAVQFGVGVTLLLKR